ncbi:MAG: NAD(P)/FAD-dependent oxidoreductase [Candidatus Eiseniibacteriota bacterium]
MNAPSNRLEDLESSYDAVVVGARAAGASTAMLLARQGLSVLAVERTAEGSDTLSTHALMRAGVVQLHRWGLLPAIEAAGTPPVRSATFHYGDETLPVEVQARDGVDALRAPRRTVLDPILAAAARAAGARVVHGLRVVDLMRDGAGGIQGAIVADPVGGVRPVTARWVIGADGIHSGVARLVRSPVEAAGQHAAAVIYGYWPNPALDGYHWYYRPGVSAGAIPTNGGLTCVFVSLPDDRFREEAPGRIALLFDRVLHESTPDLARSLARTKPAFPLRGFAGERGFLRRAWGSGWALVGDAGFFRDPIAAQGISDALRDAELLARAIVVGTPAALAGYQSARDRIALDLLGVTDAIASFDWDLDRVRALHRELSRVMGRGPETIQAFDSGASSDLVAA